MNYSLYLVTDVDLSRGRSECDIVTAAIRGGATIVQYRAKHASTRRMIATAIELVERCRAHNIPLIVNDRIDVALAVGADGVHVGQDDMPAALARKLIGPGKILGVSVENVEQAQLALADGADYLGASPIFSTPSKSDAPTPIGVVGLEMLTRNCSLPIVAIGGMNVHNAADMIRAGAAGIAVISAIVSAEDVEGAAQNLQRVIQNAQRESK